MFAWLKKFLHDYQKFCENKKKYAWLKIRVCTTKDALLKKNTWLKIRFCTTGKTFLLLIKKFTANKEFAVLKKILHDLKFNWIWEIIALFGDFT
jgi:hypothetical protein